MPPTAPLFPDPLPPGFLHRAGVLDAKAQAALTAAVAGIAAEAPFAKARTKGGGSTSAAMTNCGAAGWWSDSKGYRYAQVHPETGKPWPAMPPAFWDTVKAAVAGTAFDGFTPDACLINFYETGAKMGLHQDKDEKDFTQPIITVCLGDAADFMIGGFARGDKSFPVVVHSGDVMIMGGESRLRFHGIRKIYPGTSPLADVKGRISLTFRKAL